MQPEAERIMPDLQDKERQLLTLLRQLPYEYKEAFAQYLSSFTEQLMQQKKTGQDITQANSSCSI